MITCSVWPEPVRSASVGEKLCKLLSNMVSLEGRNPYVIYENIFCFTQKKRTFSYIFKNWNKTKPTKNHQNLPDTQPPKPRESILKKKWQKKETQVAYRLVWRYMNISDNFGSAWGTMLNTNGNWSDHIFLKNIKEASGRYHFHLLTFSQNWKGIEWDAHWEVEPC